MTVSAVTYFGSHSVSVLTGLQILSNHTNLNHFDLRQCQLQNRKKKARFLRASRRDVDLPYRHESPRRSTTLPIILNRSGR